MAFGPIDLIVLEFRDNGFDNMSICSIADLVSSEVIRILDFVVVRKDEQGEVSVKELKELPPADLDLLEPLRVEISGMITANDIKLIGKKLKENTMAAIMLFENIWAIQLKQDAFDSGGRLVMYERIPNDVVSDAIRELAEYD